MEKPFLLCIGHRGAMGYEPENTLRSIRKAMALGAPCVEIDVYWVDNHLVVFHDDRLERITNGTGILCDQSFEYLRSLDAGQGERIPTLEEVCVLIGGRAGLNIELKGPGTAEPVAALIPTLVKGGWRKDALLVSSFNHQELFDMRSLDPCIQLGVITATALTQELDFAASIGAFSIHPSLVCISPKFVEDAHVRGLKVYTYTVNERDDLARMHAMEVDGVFTNYPDRVLATYSQGDGKKFWIGRENTS